MLSILEVIIIYFVKSLQNMDMHKNLTILNSSNKKNMQHSCLQISEQLLHEYK